MNTKRFAKTLLISSLIIAGGLFISACGTVVPPGKTVILLHPDGGTDIKTKGVYKAWGRTRVYFVDGRLKSFSETMKILMADDINMDIDIKAIMSFRVAKDSIQFIREKVPSQKVTSGDIAGWELSLEGFYRLAVVDVIRGTSRNVISPFKTDEVRPNRQQIEQAIQKGVIERVAQLGYPIEISGILMSNIDYPETVRAMREEIKRVQLEEQRKEALAKAQIAQARREVTVKQEQAKARLVEAQARADENRILTESLTPAFLRWRQFEVMEKVAQELGAGANNTVFVMPYEMMSSTTADAVLIREGK